MNADDIVSQIKTNVAMPASQNRFDDKKLLGMVDAVISDTIIPFLIQLGQEYCIVSTESTVPALQEKLPIPPRAVGQIVRSIYLKSGGKVERLKYIEPELYSSYASLAGMPQGYFFQGRNIVLMPKPASSVVLDIAYPLRPSRLVSVSQCGVISNVSGNDVTVISKPSSFVVGKKIDFVGAQGTLPGSDYLIGNVSGNVLSFSRDVPALAPGDYVSLAETAPLALNVPYEAMQYIIVAAGNKVLESIGDTDLLQAGLARENNLFRNLKDLFVPRAKVANRAITIKRRPGKWAR